MSSILSQLPVKCKYLTTIYFLPEKCEKGWRKVSKNKFTLLVLNTFHLGMITFNIKSITHQESIENINQYKPIKQL